MDSNLGQTGALILAEAAYILLAMAGESDAHEVLRKLTLEVEKGGGNLVDLLKQRGESWAAIDTFLRKAKGMSAEQFFAAPGNYRGLAAEKARGIAEKYTAEMKSLSAALAREYPAQ
jgi:adenylosuccinate lyase